jgi:hypothetical protein
VLFDGWATQHKSPSDWGLRSGCCPRRAGTEHDEPALKAHQEAAVGNRPTVSIVETAFAVCQYIIDLSPCEQLLKAGVLSGNLLADEVATSPKTIVARLISFFLTSHLAGRAYFSHR